jgi:rubrerythrin
LRIECDIGRTPAGVKVKRSFTSLNPQEALHVAIFIEERNAEVYHRFAEMFVEFRDSESLEIAGVFWEMAVEEKNHSSLLQNQYMEKYGSSRCALTEEDLIEWIEVPSLEDSDLFTDPREGCTANVRDRALQVALKAELAAQRYYSGLVDSTPEGKLRRLYRELAEMEDGHVAYIQRKLVPHPTNDKTAN